MSQPKTTRREKLAFADPEALDVVRQQAIQPRLCARASREKLAHVRDIEDTQAGAHRVVFVDLRTVIDGHVPAAEIDHACVERKVSGVQGRVLKIRHGAGLGRARKQKRPCVEPARGFELLGCMDKTNATV